MVRASRARRRLCRPGMEAAQDRYLIPIRFKRLEVERKVEAATFLVGDPVAGRHAVAYEAAEKSRLRIGGGLSQCGCSRRHRFEKRQSERRAGPTQDSTTRNVLLSDKHLSLPRY